ncbi:DNA alkylation repair protein [Spirosoma arcticum]
MSTYADVRKALVSLKQPERASFAARYFQAKAGEYGEGDQFLGLSMPQQHAVAKQFLTVTPGEVEQLLRDPYHECRMTALLIWVYQVRSGLTRSGLTRSVRKAEPVGRIAIMERYLANRQYVNNWDLVDSSATALVGETLLTGDRLLLTELADEDHLWTQRIALVATLAFIRKGQFTDTFALAEQLFASEYGLVQSAIGWMLREVGKRNEAALEEFLHDHIRSLPRTALRGAIYRFDPARRRYYLNL